MSKNPPRRLTTAELGGLAEATLENSLTLLEDAEVLAVNGRWPRSFALTILAGEEFGKVMMCLGTLGNPRSDDDDFWTEFWQRFKGHKPKYENVFNMASTFFAEEEVSRDFRDHAGDHAKADQALKMAALYVDYTDGLSRPRDRVGEREVDAALQVYGMVIRSWAAATGPDVAEKFVELEVDAQRLQEARASGDQAEVERVLRDQFGVDASE